VRELALVLKPLPGWREADVAEVGEALVFTNRETTLAFWPDRRGYAEGIRGGRSFRR